MNRTEEQKHAFFVEGLPPKALRMALKTLRGDRRRAGALSPRWWREPRIKALEGRLKELGQ